MGDGIDEKVEMFKGSPRKSEKVKKKKRCQKKKIK